MSKKKVVKTPPKKRNGVMASFVIGEMAFKNAERSTQAFTATEESSQRLWEMGFSAPRRKRTKTSGLDQMISEALRK